MSRRRFFAYAAVGGALAVAITIAATGTWVPHEWPRSVVVVTLITAAALGLGVAAVAEALK